LLCLAAGFYNTIPLIRKPSMEYHEFSCAGASTLFIATADADPARIPAAAQACCRRWLFVRSFRLGDGSHTPTVDTAIKAQVAAEGYHLYTKQPTDSPPTPRLPA
jgi:hypothetical protein